MLATFNSENDLEEQRLGLAGYSPRIWWRRLKRWFHDHEVRIDHRLRVEVGGDAVEKFLVSQKELPAYRFVDTYRAIDRAMAGFPGVRRIKSSNDEALNDLLHAERPGWASRDITLSPRAAWPVGPEEEVFLPVDQYWIFPSTSSGNHVIVRLRYVSEHERLVLAVAAADPRRADEWIAKFVRDSLVSSIYRGKNVAFVYEAGTRDEYGDPEKPAKLRVSFRTATPVPQEDFIVDKEIYKILRRNVIDLHERRELLKRHGVPIRRGLLLYGPPGTGKTFACRYLSGRLTETACIFAAGTTLEQAAKIFEFARAYQPAIVFLEDVDLVFSSRDISLHASALGDLLDLMDGLRPFEDVGVVLTTNSIERLEAAIKDRPGRISQCVYFGPPRRELRSLYIAQYAKGYDQEATDFKKLVEMSQGTTPAFIKEWVHRAVQIATERIEDPDLKPELMTKDFEEAYAEMKHATDKFSRRIVGFLE